MRLDQAKELLLSNGYEVNELYSYKGSAKELSLVVGNGKSTVRPALYQKTVDDISTEGELIRFITSHFDSPFEKLDRIYSYDYICSHVLSGVRHITEDEEIIKWNVFNDLEEYLYLDISENGTAMFVNIKKQMLDYINEDIFEDELRTIARNNLRKLVEINNIADMLRMYVDDEHELDIDFMYVATVKSRIRGASVILLEDVLTNFCREKNVKSITIIPSSVDEIILLTDTAHIGEVNEIITQVNHELVDTWHWLSDHAYIFTCN